MLKVLRSSSRIVSSERVRSPISSPPPAGSGASKSPGRHLLRRLGQAPDPDRDQRGDQEADQDADRDRDQQRPEPVAAKLIEGPGQGRRRLRADDHRAAHRHVAVAEDRRGGDRDVAGQARPVAAAVERDADRLAASLARRPAPARFWPGANGVAVAVERPGLEVPGVGLGEDVRGVQLVDPAEVVGEAGGLADRQVGGLALQGAARGVVDEDVDRGGRDQATPAKAAPSQSRIGIRRPSLPTPRPLDLSRPSLRIVTACSHSCCDCPAAAATQRASAAARRSQSASRASSSETLTRSRRRVSSTHSTAARAPGRVESLGVLGQLRRGGRR